jgi:hypothetical protein
MTPCNFQGSKAKKIQANFDGGGVLLREVDKRIGLIDAINDCIALISGCIPEAYVGSWAALR